MRVTAGRSGNVKGKGNTNFSSGRHDKDRITGREAERGGEVWIDIAFASHHASPDPEPGAMSRCEQRKLTARATLSKSHLPRIADCTHRIDVGDDGRCDPQFPR